MRHRDAVLRDSCHDYLCVDQSHGASRVDLAETGLPYLERVYAGPQGVVRWASEGWSTLDHRCGLVHDRYDHGPPSVLPDDWYGDGDWAASQQGLRVASSHLGHRPAHKD